MKQMSKKEFYTSPSTDSIEISIENFLMALSTENEVAVQDEIEDEEDDEEAPFGF